MPIEIHRTGEIEEIRKELSLKLIPILNEYPSEITLPCLLMETIIAYRNEPLLDDDIEQLIGLLRNSWDTVERVMQENQDDQE